MTKRQFEGILKSGEGAMVEFKKTVSSSLGREMAAFANTAGGRIFIGVDDTNVVIGSKLTNQVKSRIQDIIHRDYFEIGARVMVEIFDDRVEISNPGELLVDKKKFGKKTISVARNPILFDIFHRLQMIEKVGTGVQRILAAIAARNLKVEFDFDSFFTIIFKRPALDKVHRKEYEAEQPGIEPIEAPRKYPASTPKVPRMI